MSRQKPFAPSAERNQEPILDALGLRLVPGYRVFEFGSGTGQHVCHFASRHLGVSWQPSDLADRLHGIRQWIAECGCTNILPPIALDLADELPPGCQANVCYTANTFHIISLSLVHRLFMHAAKLLDTHAELCVYGPFMFHGQFTSKGNRDFDQHLRDGNPTQGIREINDLNAMATKSGFSQARIIDMPANNHLAIWQRTSEKRAL